MIIIIHTIPTTTSLPFVSRRWLSPSPTTSPTSRVPPLVSRPSSLTHTRSFSLDSDSDSDGAGILAGVGVEGLGRRGLVVALGLSLGS